MIYLYSFNTKNKYKMKKMFLFIALQAFFYDIV